MAISENGDLCPEYLQKFCMHGLKLEHLAQAVEVANLKNWGADRYNLGCSIATKNSKCLKFINAANYMEYHAEQEALKKLEQQMYRNGGKKIVNGKVNLVVIRLSADLKLKDSRPCMFCIMKMKEVGLINKVYYIHNNKIKVEKLLEMEYTIISYGYIQILSKKYGRSITVQELCLSGSKKVKL